MMNVKEIMNLESLDVLQTIFDAEAERLSKITEKDKANLSKLNKDLEEKYQKIKSELKVINPINAEIIFKYVVEYIDTRDYINAYYNEKYFKERSEKWNKTYNRIIEIKENRYGIIDFIPICLLKIRWTL